MRIERLTANNIKGCSFDHELAPVTLFVGPNFSGKTTRIDAIKLALLGYHPEVVKTGSEKNNRELFRLSSGKEMDARIRVDNDPEEFGIRMWEEGRKIEVERKPYIARQPLEGNDAFADGDDMLLIVSPRRYFEMPQKERLNYMMELIDVGTAYDEEAIRKALDGVYVGKKVSENEVLAKKELIDSGILLQGTEDIDTPEWILSRVVHNIGERTKEFRAGVDRLRKALQVDTVQQSDSGNLDPEALNRRIEERGQEAAKLSEEIRQIKYWHEKLRDLEIELERCEEDLDEMPVIRPDSEIELDIKDVRKTLEFQDLDRTKHLAVYEDRKSGLEKEQTENSTSMADARARLEMLDARVKELQASQQALESNEGVCSLCGSEIEDSGQKERHLSRLREAVEQQQIEKASKQELIREGSKRRGEITERRGAVEAQIMATINAFNLIEKFEIELSETSVARLREKTAKETIKALQEQIDAIQPKPLDELQTAVDAIDEKIKLLRAARDGAIAEKARKEATAELTVELETLENRLKVLKSMNSVAKQMQRDLVADVFNELLRLGNEHFENVVGFKMEYDNEEIGYRRNGRFIPQKMWSGTEQLLGYASIALGIAQHKGISVLIMDELGLLDESTRDKFLTVVHDSVEKGYLDQFIGVSPSRLGYHVPGCHGIKTIDLGGDDE